MARRKSAAVSTDGRQWDLPAGSHVWVYLRHSPGDGQTIDSQVQAMQEWAALNGWVIDRMFIDEAAKGGNDDRQQFQEMIALAHQKPQFVAGILVWDFGRFARNVLDAQFHKAELRRLGYVIVSKIDDVPNSDIGPLVEAFIDWKNERFIKDLSLNVKRGLSFVVGQGYWPTGPVPLGYRVELVEMGRRPAGGMRYGKRVVKNEATQERVALAWKMKLEQNASLVDIYHATHLYHFPNNYGVMFDNLLYAGIFEFQGIRYPLGWEQGARFCEPYVSLEQFEQVQRLRAQRQIATIAPRSLSSPYLLSGMLQCGVCEQQGQKVNLAGGKVSRYRYYRCQHKASFRADSCNLPLLLTSRVDEAVLTLVRDVLLTPDFVRSEIERANAILSQQGDAIERQLRDARRALQARQRDVEHIVQLIQRKGVTAILEVRYDEANTAWNVAQTQVTMLEQMLTRGSVASPGLSLSEAYAILHEVLTIFDTGVVQKQRDVLKGFIDRILVFPGRLDVMLKFSIPTFTPGSPLYAVNAIQIPGDDSHHPYSHRSSAGGARRVAHSDRS